MSFKLSTLCVALCCVVSPTPALDDATGHCIASLYEEPELPIVLNCDNECSSSCVSTPVEAGTPEYPAPAYACGCLTESLSPCCQLVRLANGGVAHGGTCGGEACKPGNACVSNASVLLDPPYSTTYENAHCETH